ncbi:MAG: ornithine carbamoyltransferase [Enterobacterales bacterium]
MVKLFKKNLLRLMNLSYDEINYLLILSIKLKQQKEHKKEIKQLYGKNIALIFEKNSTRTRCAFEIAAFDQGANTTYLGLNGNQISNKESIKDTARVLNKIYDGIQYRGYSQLVLEILANYTKIPIWNGLTTEFHPTQILADLLTIKEYMPKKKFNQIKLAYIGDTQNNISYSLMEAAALTGLDLRLISPYIYWPNKIFVDTCIKISKKKGGNITVTENICDGIKYVDFIYTDVWVSMGESEKLWKKKISLLKEYQVNMKLINKTKNKNVKFLHCLPSFHDNNTIISKRIMNEFNLFGGIEVTNEVFESKYSIVFEQSENRLHTIKAMIVSSLIDVYK